MHPDAVADGGAPVAAAVPVQSALVKRDTDAGADVAKDVPAFPQLTWKLLNVELGVEAQFFGAKMLVAWTVPAHVEPDHCCCSMYPVAIVA